MLSQVVPQWFHKWGAIARCGTTHLLVAAITTFFRLAETPQFDRATLLGKRRITHGYLHVFNLIGDPTTFWGEYYTFQIGGPLNS